MADEPPLDPATGNPVDFSGVWKLTKNENFDEFYDKVEGMPWVARKVAEQTTPEMTVHQNNNHFKISITAMWFTTKSEFQVGTEFHQDPNKSGMTLVSYPRWEGEKLIVDAKPEKPDDYKLISQCSTRELNGPDETIITTTAKVKDSEEEYWVKRYFSRVK